MTITMSHSTVLGIILATICCSGISTSLFDIQEEGIAVFDMSMSVPLLVSESGESSRRLIECNHIISGLS